MKFLIGFAVIGICVLIIWKSAYIGSHMPLKWAEEHFTRAGQAGSISFYRMVAALAIVGSLLYMTGYLQTLIISVFSR